MKRSFTIMIVLALVILATATVTFAGGPGRPDPTSVAATATAWATTPTPEPPTYTPAPTNPPNTPAIPTATATTTPAPTRRVCQGVSADLALTPNHIGYLTVTNPNGCDESLLITAISSWPGIAGAGYMIGPFVHNGGLQFEGPWSGALECGSSGTATFRFGTISWHYDCQAPTATPQPTNTPEATATPAPGITPNPTATPEPQGYWNRFAYVPITGQDHFLDPGEGLVGSVRLTKRDSSLVFEQETVGDAGAVFTRIPEGEYLVEMSAPGFVTRRFAVWVTHGTVFRHTELMVPVTPGD